MATRSKERAPAGPLRLLKAREVAGQLGIGERTLWRLVSKGDIPRPLKVGRCARWRAEWIEEFVRVEEEKRK